MRFSLRWLFGLITLASVACVCLFYASLAIANALIAVIFALAPISVFGATLSRGRQRAFWFGFAVVGSMYVASAWVPPTTPSPWSVTAELMTSLHDKVARRLPVPGYPAGRMLEPPLWAFVQVGRELVTLLCAITGGLVAYWIDGRNTKRPA